MKRTWHNKDLVSPQRNEPTVSLTPSKVGMNMTRYKTTVDRPLGTPPKDRLHRTLLQRGLAQKRVNSTAASPNGTMPMFDSGAGMNCCGREENFTKLTMLRQPQSLFTANDSHCRILGHGTITFEARDVSGTLQIVEFTGVAFSPDLGNSCYMDTTTMRTKHSWTVEGDCKATQWRTPAGIKLQLKVVDGMEVLEGRYLTVSETHQLRVNGFTSRRFSEHVGALDKSGLLKLIADPKLDRWQFQEVSLLLAKRGTLVHDSTSKWLAIHHLLGHPSARVTSRHARKHGIKMTQVEEAFCHSCLAAKQKKSGRGKGKRCHLAPPPLTSFAVDCWGPVSDGGPREPHCVVTYVDYTTAETFSCFMPNLKDVPTVTRQWLSEIRKLREEGAPIQVDVPPPRGNSTVTNVHSDSATHFKSSKMAELAQEFNMNLTFSPPDRQDLNGKAERYLGILATRAKALLYASGLPDKDWWLAWMHVELINNQTIRNGSKESKSPQEKRTGKPPPDPTDTYPAFGAKCSVWIADQHRTGKLAKRAREGITVGWCKQSNAPLVRVHTPTGRVVLRVTGHSRIDPRLPAGVYRPAGAPTIPDLPDEALGQGRPEWLARQPDRPETKIDRANAREYDWSNIDIPTMVGGNAQPEPQAHHALPPQKRTAKRAREGPDDLCDHPEELQEEPDTTQQQGHPNAPNPGEISIPELGTKQKVPTQSRQGKRAKSRAASKNRRSPRLHEHRPGDTVEVLSGSGYRIHAIGTKGKPTTAYSYQQACKRFPGFETHLKEAAIKEVTGLTKIAMEEIPEDQISEEDRNSAACLLSIWGLKYEGGQFHKAKVRCCYKGQDEVYDVDYKESTSTVPRLSSFRTFLALRPRGEDHVDIRVDVAQAYLKAELEELPANDRKLVVFPFDITPRYESGQRKMYRLVRSLYGQHAAGAMWQKRLFTYLRKCDLVQNARDPCLWTNEDKTLQVLCYVDDLAIRGGRKDTQKLVDQLTSEFGDVGPKPLDHFLGITIHRDQNGMLMMESSAYIEQTLKKENLVDINTREVPLPPETRITKDDRAEHVNTGLQALYRRLLGQVSYLSVWSRPEISYPVAGLASVASSPKPTHLALLKRVLGHLKGTAHRGIRWYHTPPERGTHHDPKQQEAEQYWDTWKPDQLRIFVDASWGQEHENTSQTGVIAQINGGPVHWISTRQTLAALSSTEAEIIAASTALREALYLREVMEEMGAPQQPIEICIDNANCLRFAEQGKITPRNHHIGVRHFRLRQEVTAGRVKVVFCRTHCQAADLGTKNPAEDQFERLVALIMADWERENPSTPTANATDL